MEVVLVYIVLIIIFAALPIVLDICLAYRSQNRMRQLLIEKASLDKFELEELREFVKESGKAPPGIPGLARATMALTVIVILGIAVFHLLVKGTTADNSQIISNVLSMLAGLLAAITGFYFGGKTPEKKVEEEKK